jgi:hypothetical protein
MARVEKYGVHEKTNNENKIWKIWKILNLNLKKNHGPELIGSETTTCYQ